MKTKTKISKITRKYYPHIYVHNVPIYIIGMVYYGGWVAG